ncbi:MAG TPA: hypothetical protein DEP53_02080 [Bacteroidetes bacterium]|nr:hypothetical protein [Bacteroidota bacterium]
MKHLIITAIVCLGLVAQSSVVAVDQQADNGQAVAAIGSSPAAGSQQLTAQEMSMTIGGDNLTGCWGYTDEEGDYHYVCCVDLWIITICGGVNLSAFERLLNF